jgi:hypothetical protein
MTDIDKKKVIDLHDDKKKLVKEGLKKFETFHETVDKLGLAKELYEMIDETVDKFVSTKIKKYSSADQSEIVMNSLIDILKNAINTVYITNNINNIDRKKQLLEEIFDCIAVMLEIYVGIIRKEDFETRKNDS